MTKMLGISMSVLTGVGLAALLIAAPFPAGDERPAPQAAGAPDFAAIAERVSPAVVQITVEKLQRGQPGESGEDWPFEEFWNRFFGRSSPQEPREYRSGAQGTGFFISPEGDLLTNFHIVQDAVRITIQTLQGDEFTDAEVVGTDPLTDLALLKVDVRDVPSVRLGSSGDLRVGEWLLAVGNPFGLEHTVTAGICSAKGRQIDAETYQAFIQTDAAINRGNSGGPLVNMDGEVVGVTSSILAPAGGNIGIGFAIPTAIATHVIAQLRESGRVVRGWLGVTTQEVTAAMTGQLELVAARGVLVSSVEEGSPAAKAGLKPYDVIIEVDGRSVESPNDLAFMIAELAPGQEVELAVLRDGRETTLTPRIAERADGNGGRPDEAAPEGEEDMGLSVRALTPSLARRFGLETTEGLLITRVEEHSESARRGLQPGMIIVEANRRPVDSVGEFERIVEASAAGEQIMLLVRTEAEGRIRQFVTMLRVP